MIAVALLHPHQAKPVRRWVFDRDVPIHIGRSPDSDVILYSAVISRRHLELRYQAGSWWAVNHGKNGTYANGLSFDRLQIGRAVTIRLAKSGPRLHIELTDVRQVAPTSTEPAIIDLDLDDLDEEDATIADISTPAFAMRAAEQ
ncbi:MAG: FHA domain-containing protein [Geitlerinemataceae cyanobacterium]